MTEKQSVCGYYLFPCRCGPSQVDIICFRVDVDRVKWIIYFRVDVDRVKWELIAISHT